MSADGMKITGSLVTKPANTALGKIKVPQAFKDDDTVQAGARIGAALDVAETQLLEAYSNPSASPAETKAAEMAYQKALRMFEAFSQLMRNMHEIIVNGIRRLEVR